MMPFRIPDKIAFRFIFFLLSRKNASCNVFFEQLRRALLF